MSDDRRFSEREIREVFERAAAEQERAARHSPDDGLTVEEMQEVAASAGIDPAFVASAARAVALGEPESGRETLGPVPTGVFRTELLPDPPTDALWEALVADLRHTFGATGRVTSVGRLREWRNGNLRVSLEPSGDGSRLRFSTRREGTQASLAVSAVAAFAGVAILLAGGTQLAWADFGAFLAGLLVLVAGSAAMLSTAIGQRRWVETRERQMEAIAERAAAFSGPTPAGAARAAAPVDARLDLDLLDDNPLADDDRPRPRRRTR